MLRSHERRVPECLAAGNVNNCYNEVVLDADAWDAHLPELVEAVAYPRGSSRAEIEARAAAARFLERFGRAVPLVEMALRAHADPAAIGDENASAVFTLVEPA